ncbi:MAG TPA: hypothetical protein VF053_18145 [Streptosporangiales bacterium]
MPTRASERRLLARTSWGPSGWLADERLVEHGAEPLTIDQRRAVWRILDALGDAAESDYESRHERFAAEATVLVLWIASQDLEQLSAAERDVLLRNIVHSARSARGPDYS